MIGDQIKTCLTLQKKRVLHYATSLRGCNAYTQPFRNVIFGMHTHILSINTLGYTIFFSHINNDHIGKKTEKKILNSKTVSRVSISYIKDCMILESLKNYIILTLKVIRGY